MYPKWLHFTCYKEKTVEYRKKNCWGTQNEVGLSKENCASSYHIGTLSSSGIQSWSLS